jgi:hypothetical protein
MSGTTTRGIRYPDGTTKALNLGPELAIMAGDLDAYIFANAVPGATGGVGPTGATGPQGPSGVLTSTGSPQGVTTANPGTLYVDTASTLGVSVWRKNSGTGNTGWDVVSGDTGWRNIAETVSPMWTASSLLIRRTNTIVSIEGNITVAAAGTSTSGYFSIFPVPLNYRPRTASAIGIGLASTTIGMIGPFSSTSEIGSFRFMETGGTWTVGRVVSFSLSYSTTDAWPTALPGTAA